MTWSPARLERWANVDAGINTPAHRTESALRRWSCTHRNTRGSPRRSNEHFHAGVQQGAADPNRVTNSGQMMQARDDQDLRIQAGQELEMECSPCVRARFDALDEDGGEVTAFRYCTLNNFSPRRCKLRTTHHEVFIDVSVPRSSVRRRCAIGVGVRRASISPLASLGTHRFHANRKAVSRPVWGSAGESS